MFKTDEEMHNYAEQVRSRVQAINNLLHEEAHRAQFSVNRDSRVKPIMDNIFVKMQTLTEFILVGNFTQKRVNVIENYLQEVEVLLNIDE